MLTRKSSNFFGERGYCIIFYVLESYLKLEITQRGVRFRMSSKYDVLIKNGRILDGTKFLVGLPVLG